MSRMSINAASKLFSVSRPTILKHLNNGNITGDKDPETGHWTIDKSELARAYSVRAKDTDYLPATYTSRVSGLDSELHATIERLEKQLAVAEARAEERQQRIEAQDQRMEQTLKLLEGPKNTPKRGKWWLFW